MGIVDLRAEKRDEPRLSGIEDKDVVRVSLDGPLFDVVAIPLTAAGVFRSGQSSVTRVARHCPFLN